MIVRRKRLLITSGIIVVIALGAAVVFADPILYSLGAILVHAEAPQKADMVVVIGGDFKGNRILKGAQLVREGYSPKVLTSGAGTIYGQYECDLAIEYAVSRGYSPDSFITLRYYAESTTDEAQAVIARLRQLGVHKYLLVTSDYHTARAGHAFRRAGPDLEEHTISAPDPDWNGGRWWEKREGRKIWLFEILKTVADRFGI